jgi:hypothetical protein
VTTRARVALPRQLAGWRRGRFVLDDAILRLNLSSVLHERSDSQAVSNVVERIRSHQRTVTRLAETSRLALISDIPAANGGSSAIRPDLILTANIGLPKHLPTALKRAEWGDLAVIAIDDPRLEAQTATFFRSSAQLVLPTSHNLKVSVCGLILRPGARSVHLRVSQTFRWPEQRLYTIGAIETLIQAYADQWMPQRALWPAPAEQLLVGEIR